MKIEEIKSKMESADASMIAKITGFTSDYVRKVIDGHRKSEKVIEIAKKVIENRQQFLTNTKN